MQLKFQRSHVLPTCCLCSKDNMPTTFLQVIHLSTATVLPLILLLFVFSRGGAPPSRCINSHLNPGCITMPSRRDEAVTILLVKLTGSKLPDPACYGHTQFHLVPDRYQRDRMASRQQSDQVEVFLRANGIASLFAWTGAQATYQGEYRGPSEYVQSHKVLFCV